MSATFVLDASLAALTLGVAAYAIFARQAFSAIVAFITYGLLLALVWVRLSAVDVALTEAAIGSGVTGALLIGAAARVGDGGARRPADLGPLAKTLCALLCALATAGSPPPSCRCRLTRRRWRRSRCRQLPKTGLGNPVTGVLLAYRAIDTLLESVVLVVALIGVWSFCADADWGGKPESPTHARPGRSSRLSRAAPAAARASSSAFTSFGQARTSPAARFRAGRYWPRCGSSS